MLSPCRDEKNKIATYRLLKIHDFKRLLVNLNDVRIREPDGPLTLGVVLEDSLEHLLHILIADLLDAALSLGGRLLTPGNTVKERA